MERSGTFIQYLIARDGVVNREYIDIDDISTLETQFTKRGKLRSKLKTRFINGPYYLILARQPGKWGPLETYDYASEWVVRNTINRIKNHEKFSEIVVIAYNDDEFTQPRSITANDLIVVKAKKYHSKELAKWVERNQESELI
ncbi:hypothetical protein PV-S19_0409 [Pacmanvirus S19]|nr:hypothetical protein PV-S19_0409 [Pacmanvirus S19]